MRERVTFTHRDHPGRHPPQELPVIRAPSRKTILTSSSFTDFVSSFSFFGLSGAGIDAGGEGGGLLDPRIASACFTSSILTRPFNLSSLDGGDEDRRRAEGESGARGDRGDGGMAVGVRKDILTNQAEYLVSD